MSRIGKLPIEIPQGVELTRKGESIEVKGPKGMLEVLTHPKIIYDIGDGAVTLSRADESRTAREQHGLRRTLLSNAVTGVSKGFEKGLEVIGVGYKVNLEGSKVVLSVGYSHPVEYLLPKEVSARVEGTKIFLSSMDKQILGEVAAQIRRVRKPEPYKGKGIKYMDETIRRKAGKSGAK
ncbi:MAG: 50S ribosomal protein L6 [Desulfovibrionales bacterium]